MVKYLLLVVNAQRFLYFQPSKKINFGPTEHITNFSFCDNVPLSQVFGALTLLSL